MFLRRREGRDNLLGTSRVQRALRWGLWESWWNRLTYKWGTYCYCKVSPVHSMEYATECSTY